MTQSWSCVLCMLHTVLKAPCKIIIMSKIIQRFCIHSGHDLSYLLYHWADQSWTSDFLLHKSTVTNIMLSSPTLIQKKRWVISDFHGGGSNYPVLFPQVLDFLSWWKKCRSDMWQAVRSVLHTSVYWEGCKLRLCLEIYKTKAPCGVLFLYFFRLFSFHQLILDLSV